MKKLRFICLLMALVLAFSLCACGGKSSKIDTSNAIKVGITQAPISFDMLTYGTGVAYQLVFEGLFDMNPVTGEVEPWLAESYEWIDDCTIRIKLRDNVFFSNGEKMTAEDVLYSYKRHTETSSTVKSNYSIYDFDKCYAEDELTVVFTTHEPNGSLLLYMAKYPDIVCKSYYEKLDSEKLWDHTCGTGPYVVNENISGSHYTLSLREDYWNTEYMPEVQMFQLVYYGEMSTMLIDFGNGDLDAIIGLDESTTNRLMNGEVEGAVVETKATYNVDYLVLPEYVAAFQDSRVRQAIAIGVDWSVVTKNAYGSLGQQATSVLPTSMSNYYKNEGAYVYDPDAARALLEEAGYSSGDIVLNALASTTPEHLRIYETLQYYLNEIGITLNFTTQEMSAVMPSVTAGKTDLFVLLCLSSPSVPEPTTVLEHANKNSMMKTCVISDAEYNSYWDAFVNSNDEAQRSEAMDKVQDWHYNNYWLIPICERTFSYAYGGRIEMLHVTSNTNPELRFTELAGE